MASSGFGLLGGDLGLQGIRKKKDAFLSSMIGDFDNKNGLLFYMSVTVPEEGMNSMKCKLTWPAKRKRDVWISTSMAKP